MCGTQSNCGRFLEGQNFSPLPGFDFRTVQPLASRYIDCVITVLNNNSNNNNNNNNKGVTFLIPKNENTENPKNYRPVTCLPTIYKLMTSIISRRMQKYTDDENLMPKEQKGCGRGSKDAKISC